MPKRERETTSSTSHSHLLSRRDFVATTSLIGAGLVIGPLSWTGCSNQSSGVSSSAETGSVRGLNKMKTRQLGTLERHASVMRFTEHFDAFASVCRRSVVGADAHGASADFRDH